MTSTHTSPVPQTGSATSITDPAQIHQAFMDATNAGDVDALCAMYDPDGVAVELDGGEAHGAHELREMFVGLTTAIAHIDGTTRKVLVAGDIALTSASWTAQVQLPDGTVIEQRGTTAEVSKRRPDGTWAVVIDDPLF